VFFEDQKPSDLLILVRRVAVCARSIAASQASPLPLRRFLSRRRDGCDEADSQFSTAEPFSALYCGGICT
jgi:hypothetical protein